MHHFFHIQADSVISRNQDKAGYTDISDDRNRNINPGANPVRHTAVRGGLLFGKILDGIRRALHGKHGG